MRYRLAWVAAMVVAVVVALVVIIASLSSSRRARPAVSPPSPAPARPAPTAEQFGASVNLLFNNPVPSAVIAAQLRALRATGATLARSDALWEASEPAPPTDGVHHWQWSFDDRVAAALAQAGLRWLPVLDYSAPWAQSIPGQDHSPPRSASDYAAYAGAFAARYGSRGSFWRQHPGLASEPVQTYEIWNEPDNGEFWTPGPDAGRYASLYVAARTAIDDADPAARVIVGGLTNPDAFLPAMLAADPALRGQLDGVAIHPYGRPAVALSRLQGARRTLDGLRLNGVALYVTEFGWTTQPPGAQDYVAAGRRPAYIRRTLAQLEQRSCGVAAAILYTWYSPESDPSDSQQWYGIDGLSGAPNLDTAAFARGLQDATRTAARRCY